MSVRSAGTASLIASVLLWGGGCNGGQRLSARLRPVRVDVDAARFDPERFEDAQTIWAYADNRALPSREREEWERQNIRIGKVSRENIERIEGVLKQAAAEVRVEVLEVPSGTVIPLEAAGRIPVPVTSLSGGDHGEARAGESMLVFRVQVERLKQGEVQLIIEPLVVDSTTKQDLGQVKKLGIPVRCRAGESVLIGPATAESEGLGKYLRSSTREGWIQVFQVRVPK